MMLKLRYNKLSETFEIIKKDGEEVSIILGDPYVYDDHIDLSINFDVDLSVFDSNNFELPLEAQ